METVTVWTRTLFPFMDMLPSFFLNREKLQHWPYENIGSIKSSQSTLWFWISWSSSQSGHRFSCFQLDVDLSTKTVNFNSVDWATNDYCCPWLKPFDAVFSLYFWHCKYANQRYSIWTHLDFFEDTFLCLGATEDWERIFVDSKMQNHTWKFKNSRVGFVTKPSLDKISLYDNAKFSYHE